MTGTRSEFDGVLRISSALGNEFKIVELSHVLEEGIPTWPTHARYSRSLYESQQFGDISCHAQLVMSEHSGTHVDAPSHFVPDGKFSYGIDEVSADRLIGRAAMIDASDLPPNGLLRKEDISKWEDLNGQIGAGDIVLVRFGWDKRWALRPNHRDFLQDWPGIGPDSAAYLTEKGIAAFGTDAPSADASDSTELPGHYTFLGNGVLILENLTNLDQLGVFSLFIALPLRIRDGSASPIRPIAYIPKQ